MEYKMSGQNNEMLYTYSCTEKATQYGVALFSCVFALVLITTLFIALPQIWAQVALDSAMDIVLFGGGVLFCLLGAALFPLLFSNNLPSIRISDKGISVQIFLFWWVFVPWEEVEEIKKRPLSKSRLVVVRRLTPVHRLIGSTLTGFKPAFVLKSTLIGFNEAVKTIERKIESK